MSCGSCGPCGSCAGCTIIKGICALLVTLLTIAALVGVYKTHMTADGWEFSTLNASVAILASVFSLKVWLHLVKSMCPCNRMMCKDGSCSSGGMCPGCGKSPCMCK